MNTKTRILNIGRLFFMIPFVEKYLRSRMLKNPTKFIEKLIPNNYQYPAGSYRVYNCNGVTLKADIRDYVGHYLYFGFKDHAQEKLMSLVEPGNTIFDIGTNIGSTLLQFANLVGENGKVYGFEPDPVNFASCMTNVGLNKFKNLEVNNIGLGDENGKFSLVVDTPTNRGGNRIQSYGHHQRGSVTVNVQKLDDWLINAGLLHLDLIKIDVEGFEMNVLKGGVETITKFRPMMFIELDNNNLMAAGASAKQVVAFLLGHDYTITNAETDERVYGETNFENCHFDIICRHH